jgi:hypothetical protein
MVFPESSENKNILGGDVALTANTGLYWSRENLAPREFKDLGCSKTDLVGQPNGYN